MPLHHSSNGGGIKINNVIIIVDLKLFALNLTVIKILNVPLA